MTLASVSVSSRVGQRILDLFSFLLCYIEGPRGIPVVFLKTKQYSIVFFILFKLHLIFTSNVLTFGLAANVSIVPICIIAGAFLMISARMCS